MIYNFKMLENEYWWGGTSEDGLNAPFDSNTEISHDFRTDASNQTMPMYLSSLGRCIWSENPFKVTVNKGEFEIEGEDVTIETFGDCLKDAYLGAMNKYFPPSGEELEREFFRVPQYNTWMQMTYNQTQEGVLKYAREIIENGFKPGILMIDEGWQKDYGMWEFEAVKFPNPEEMLKELHQMGFKVMLWVAPYVTPNGKFYISHTQKHLLKDKSLEYFLRLESGNVAKVGWWNGFSAILDLRKKEDRDLLDGQLKALMDIGVDGFKFDGGSVHCYSEEMQFSKGNYPKNHSAAECNIAWNEFGTRYKYHEYKDTFKGGGKRSIQRICDRDHSWGEKGLASFIPNGLLQGIIGHPFVCPDMIGGGSWTFRELNLPVDQELFVRMAQCSAFFPMMQFSWAPWEAVDDEHLALIKAAHDLHCDLGDEIVRLVDKAHEDGQPIMRTLEYNYPHKGYEKIDDVFMLGDEYLVAPVVVKGQTVREIPLPEGKWLGFDGNEYEGGKTVSLNVTLADMPYFKKIQ